MSTPTTATATIPHSHYHHPSHHHFPYYDPYRSAANQILPSSSRLAPSYPASSTSSYVPSSGTQTSSTTINGSSFSSNSSLARSQRQELTDLPAIIDQNYTTMAPSKASVQAPSNSNSNSNSNSQSTRKRRRNSPVDWSKFYGGQPPKEIIVIDDTPEPESAAVSAVSASQTLTNGSTAYSYTNGNGVGAGVSANTSAARHAPKRRKRDEDAPPVATGTRYDPVHHSRLNGSTTTTPRQNGNPSGSTMSSDRTNSAIHTTAATSLGSLSSNGQYDHDAQPGQKRKRTRQQVANEVKRRDNYPSYHPPPHPPKKAGDVHVRVIPDVGSFLARADTSPLILKLSRRTRVARSMTVTVTIL